MLTVSLLAARKETPQMLQVNPTPLSARSANSTDILLVGKIGLKKLRAAVGPTSKMRKDTLRSLRDKPRFSRRRLAPLSDRVVLLLGPEMGCKEIRKFVLDKRSPMARSRGQGSGVPSAMLRAGRESDRLISPIPFPRILATETTQNRRESV